MPSNDAQSCPRCGSPVTYAGLGRRPVWCSQTCRQEAYEARRTARENGQPVQVVWRGTTPEPASMDDHVEAVLNSPQAIVRVLRHVIAMQDDGSLWSPKWQRLATFLLSEEARKVLPRASY